MKRIIIKGNTYQIPTNEKEISVLQYFKYLSILETYRDWLTALDDGEIEDDFILKELSFNVDMICAVSDIPKEVLQNYVPSTQILHISKFILSEELEDESYLITNTAFEFIDCTPQEIQELKDKIKATKWYRIDQKIILSYRLYKMQKPVLFLIAPDLSKQSMSQWIITESLRRKIVEASEGMKNGMYQNISKIIAYISKRENEEYCEKTAERRAEVFQHLPLHTANQIAGFFLTMFEEYKKTSLTYSEEQTKKTTTTKN